MQGLSSDNKFLRLTEMFHCTPVFRGSFVMMPPTCHSPQVRNGDSHIHASHPLALHCRSCQIPQIDEDYGSGGHHISVDEQYLQEGHSCRIAVSQVGLEISLIDL